MNPTHTAILTLTPDVADTVNCAVSVVADTEIELEENVTVSTPGDTVVMADVDTSIPLGDNPEWACNRADEVLAANGWTRTDTWFITNTAAYVTVTRPD